MVPSTRHIVLGLRSIRSVSDATREQRGSAYGLNRLFLLTVFLVFALCGSTVSAQSVTKLLYQKVMKWDEEERTRIQDLIVSSLSMDMDTKMWSLDQMSIDSFDKVFYIKGDSLIEHILGYEGELLYVGYQDPRSAYSFIPGRDVMDLKDSVGNSTRVEMRFGESEAGKLNLSNRKQLVRSGGKSDINGYSCKNYVNTLAFPGSTEVYNLAKKPPSLENVTPTYFAANVVHQKGFIVRIVKERGGNGERRGH